MGLTSRFREAADEFRERVARDLEEATHHGLATALAEHEELREAQPEIADEDALAVTAVELALTFPEWVRRRKWTFDYVDDTTVRHQMSVDFRLPAAERLVSPPGRGETIYVPLWIPRKTPLTNVDVRDEEGRVLSVLNRTENGRIAAHGLFAMFYGVAHERGVEVDPAELHEAVLTIATAQPHTDADELAKAANSPALTAALKDGDERWALVQDLTSGFLLMVPVEYVAGRNRVIKLSYDMPHLWHGEDPGWADRLRSALASLGLADKELRFERFPIGLARGNHFQVNAPPSVDVAALWIDVIQHDPDRREAVRIPRRQAVYGRARAEVNVSPRARYDPDNPPVPTDPDDPEDPANVAYRDFASSRSDEATVKVRLAPYARDVFAGALVVCLLTTPLLWLVDRRLVELDGQTSAALLLALPAILTAFLARPGEHAYAARLIFGVRVMGLVVGACALGVAAIIGAGGIRDVPPEKPAATVEVRCEATNEPAPALPRRAVQLSELRCVVPGERPPEKPKPTVNATAQAAVTVLAALASLATFVLAAGFARTLFTDLRRRHRDLEESEQPA